jgi:uncharacterized protein YbjT (DUF2867 family)
LLTQRSIIEQVLGELSIPVCFLRPAGFMENSSWDVAPSAKNGVFPSFLQPLASCRPATTRRGLGGRFQDPRP